MCGAAIVMGSWDCHRALECVLIIFPSKSIYCIRCERSHAGRNTLHSLRWKAMCLHKVVMPTASSASTINLSSGATCQLGYRCHFLQFEFTAACRIHCVCWKMGRHMLGGSVNTEHLVWDNLKRNGSLQKCTLMESESSTYRQELCTLPSSAPPESSICVVLTITVS